jgi:hypothetical protein
MLVEGGGGGGGVNEGAIEVLGEEVTKVLGVGDAPIEGETEVFGVGEERVEGVNAPVPVGETMAVSSIEDAGGTTVLDGDKLSVGVVTENGLVGTLLLSTAVGGITGELAVTAGWSRPVQPTSMRLAMIEAIVKYLLIFNFAKPAPCDVRLV